MFVTLIVVDRTATVRAMEIDRRSLRPVVQRTVRVHFHVAVRSMTSGHQPKRVMLGSCSINPVSSLTRRRDDCLLDALDLLHLRLATLTTTTTAVIIIISPCRKVHHPNSSEPMGSLGLTPRISNGRRRPVELLPQSNNDKIPSSP